jgi:putative ABC transport system permease protein
VAVDGDRDSLAARCRTPRRGRAVIGTLAGLAGSAGVARALWTLLFGVGAHDPATFVGVPALFIVVAAIACYLPARHARRVDPIAAINADL